MVLGRRGKASIAGEYHPQAGLELPKIKAVKKRRPFQKDAHAQT